MSDTASQTSALAGSHLISTLIHTAQLLLTIIILGLSAYGVHHSSNDVVVYSVIACICTLVVCAYLIGSSVWFRDFWAPCIVVACQVWMLIFWAIDLALLVHLAGSWQGPACTSGLYEYSCAPYEGHDALAMRISTHKTYYGTLVAGVVLAALELILWFIATYLVLWQIHPQSIEPTAPSRTHPQQLSASSHQFRPLTTQNSNPAIPQPVHTPADSWPYAPLPPRSNAQPVLPDPSPGDGDFYASPGTALFSPERYWSAEETQTMGVGYYLELLNVHRPHMETVAERVDQIGNPTVVIMDSTSDVSHEGIGGHRMVLED
ncbi:hypothetical protein CC86DRAFT_457818 [Ophiobolus disseminans]|uniref:MARVEL domain-containing protein n=1 Tax=Ophiobolus disseminans TaxID=1469910 RepID=A0A6A6ZRP5_9PLEO|nr:hypothetical protein CC86DRAFT_457818 [Ophiobolus disseminans]